MCYVFRPEETPLDSPKSPLRGGYGLLGASGCRLVAVLVPGQRLAGDLRIAARLPPLPDGVAVGGKAGPARRPSLCPRRRGRAGRAVSVRSQTPLSRRGFRVRGSFDTTVWAGLPELGWACRWGVGTLRVSGRQLGKPGTDFKLQSYMTGSK